MEMVKTLTPAAKARMKRKRMNRKAKRLFIKPLTPTTCLVWGGESEHVVTFDDGFIYCDCSSWKDAKDGNCSHVMKFRMTYGDLKR